MEVTLMAKHRLVVMRIYGEIDHHMAGEIKKRAEREIKSTGAVNIALDFGGVTFMDSSGIGMIIGRYRTVRALGGSLIIFDASQQVLRLIEMAGINDLVLISDTLQHGINMMKSGKGARINA